MLGCGSRDHRFVASCANERATGECDGVFSPPTNILIAAGAPLGSSFAAYTQPYDPDPRTTLAPFSVTSSACTWGSTPAARVMRAARSVWSSSNAREMGMPQDRAGQVRGEAGGWDPIHAK